VGFVVIVDFFVVGGSNDAVKPPPFIAAWRPDQYALIAKSICAVLVRDSTPGSPAILSSVFVPQKVFKRRPVSLANCSSVCLSA